MDSSLFFVRCESFKSREDMQTKKVSIQGIRGSFHEQAALEYFNGLNITMMPAVSFEILSRQLKNGESDYAVMAIENSIAGSILQNYRLLRENDFRIIGEIYLPIRHSLLCNHGVQLQDIKEVRSHPMAINQCLDFLHVHLPGARMVETEDTALSAKELSERPQASIACIANARNAALYDLQLLAESIETYKSNITRFFILQRSSDETAISMEVDKASIYLRIPDKKGQLLQVLEAIHQCDINLSKLQSYPVSGSLRSYFFYIDLEFEKREQYEMLLRLLDGSTTSFKEMGLYKSADSLLFEASPVDNHKMAIL